MSRLCTAFDVLHLDGHGAELHTTPCHGPR
jgi:hypothetical protein